MTRTQGAALRPVTCEQDIRDNADAAGSFFFSPDTMRAWGSRLLAGVWPMADGGILFLTSDRDFDGVRVYNVRGYYETTDGRVEIDGPEGGSGWPTADSARRFARLLAAGVPNRVAAWMAENNERDTDAARVLGALATLAA